MAVSFLGRGAGPGGSLGQRYTRSPLEDSRLFGPSPWKFLATTYEKMGSWAIQPLAKIL